MRHAPLGTLRRRRTGRRTATAATKDPVLPAATVQQTPQSLQPIVEFALLPCDPIAGVPVRRGWINKYLTPRTSHSTLKYDHQTTSAYNCLCNTTALRGCDARTCVTGRQDVLFPAVCVWAPGFHPPPAYPPAMPQNMINGSPMPSAYPSVDVALAALRRYRP